MYRPGGGTPPLWESEEMTLRELANQPGACPTNRQGERDAVQRHDHDPETTAEAISAHEELWKGEKKMSDLPERIWFSIGNGVPKYSLSYYKSLGATEFVRADIAPAAAGSLHVLDLQAVRDQLEIQGRDGNWNYDQYMAGMYSGLECAL